MSGHAHCLELLAADGDPGQWRPHIHPWLICEGNAATACAESRPEGRDLQRSDQAG